MRTRLTVLYGGLFLAGGAVLLGLTFGLVSHSLSSEPRPSPSSIAANDAFLRACKNNSPNLKGGVPIARSPKTPKTTLAQCEKAFELGVQQSAATQRDRTLTNLRLWSLIGLGLLTLVSAGLGWIISGRVLGPVRRITDAAQRASDAHLGERLNLIGPNDELKILADTFDAMLDRLDSALTTQRQFVANASHELRTPLTVMRTAIDVVLAKPSRTPEQLEAMAAKVRRSVDQADVMIDALLTLAQSDQDLVVREFVDLSTAAEDALDVSSPTIADMSLHVVSRLDAAEVNGDRVLLERMVANLVENAARHNVTGGTIEIATGVDERGAFLAISNSGPVIPPGRTLSLLEPFQRLNGRTGTGGGVGLGLSIVRSVAGAHGASLDVHGRAQGGLDILVVFGPP
ncbi:MAG TPA: ATP-binding protein [Acidimicrobiales bacterium]